MVSGVFAFFEKVEKIMIFSSILASFLVHFCIIFGQKSKKWHPKRHPKIDAEKVSKNDAKMDQKWGQNGPKIHPNFSQQTDFFRAPYPCGPFINFSTLGLRPGAPKNGRIDFFRAFLGQPRFSGCPARSQKSPLKIKNLKNGGWQVGARRPYVLAYEKHPIWASIWESFWEPFFMNISNFFENGESVK